MTTATATDQLYIAEPAEPARIAELIASHAFEIRTRPLNACDAGATYWCQLIQRVTVEAPWSVADDECAAMPIRQIVTLHDGTWGGGAGSVRVRVRLSETQDADMLDRGLISYDVDRL